MEETLAARRDRRRIMVAACAAACVGWTTIFVQPVMLTEMMDRFALDEASAGLALTLEMLAVSIASILCSRLCRGWSFLTLGVMGALVATAGNAATVLTQDYAGLLAARVVAGMGEGIALMVASAAPAGFADPERVYARINLATLLVGTLVVSLAPLLPPGLHAAMPIAMILAFALALPCLCAMPRQHRYRQMVAQEFVPSSRGIAPLWSGFFLITAASAAIVSLCGLFGQRAGVSSDGVNAVIGLSILFAIGGSFLSALVGGRLGRLPPMLIGLTGVSAMLVIMSQFPDAFLFRWSVCLQMLGVYFMLPYFFGAAADADPSGRGVAALNAAIPLSYAIGPLLGGATLQLLGLGAIGWLAAITGMLVIGILVAHHHRGDAGRSLKRASLYRAP